MLKLEKRQADSRLMAYMSPVIAIVATLITGSLLFVFLGHHPGEALYTFFIAPLENVYGWTELGVKVAPLVLCAMGLTLCYRAQIWNIGAEGQFIMGALGGGYCALQFLDSESHWVLVPILLAGMVSGLLWGGIAALLKTRFNANEILTTIMLNYIALNLLLWAVHGPLKDPDGFNFPESAMFSAGATLPLFDTSYRLNISILFALFFLVVIWTLMARSWVGYQIHVMGEDAKAAKYAGFKSKALTWVVLLACGALAGLAGVSEVTGPIGQVVPQLSPGYGYAAIIVVFLGRMHPVGILLAAMLLALTFMGGEMVQIQMSLPKSLTGLFQGMLLFFLLAADLLIGYRIVFQPSASRA
ncbi:MAG: sugar ABC transporter permease [Oceanospirillaceae bacterium]|uniref:ABC transporter permease n=1 Tax=unclassified Thalassolituus TaxID=2624967 RepID=UPI000C67ECE6|nr:MULTISPECIES: ABC transporter permease [unclassified Thalassolituus]MAS25994.1 sugar ABC transporter permease [Oceanospirillaceae bacterium]MBL35337.1 sugar ABC transporter permease [Oceanospirillaceae bacterium]MBS51959.1 sugar ABC transporter permease [Oceanospirillaceae bacterium]|tara:strand:- start:2601 stop:3671 length:1071 start_codon:yes stop_codon:yes gene_type:complete